MGKTSGNTIEINGRKYDTRTGSLIGTHSIDGTLHARPAEPQKPVAHAAHAIQPVTLKQASRPTRSTAAAHADISRGKTQKSHTLMRHAVRKPNNIKPNIDQRSMPIANAPVVLDGVGRRLLPTAYDTSRAHRAKAVNKSKLVQKFSEFSQSAAQSAHTTAQKVVARQAPASVVPMPVATQPKAPYTPTHTGSTHRAQDNFARTALANATAHEQKPVKKAKFKFRTAKKLGTSTKVVSMGAASLAVLLFGAFFAYQSVPNFAVRVAAARSGVHAGLPGYQPSGFGIKGAVSYSAGQVKIAYQAHADKRNYTVTQKNTTWNSDALLTNYVASTGKMYQTYQDQGRTIYIYDGTNATWVNGGVWYDISGSSSLNSEQLVRIATSM